MDPESITVLDPACGSGHILVEAYALLKGIYLERGYRLRDIPRLILEKNLYGLDIDDRAAQLAGFALLMKARADDRRLFNDPPRLNVLSLQESKGLDLDELATHLAPFGVQRGTVKALLDTFEHAKTFGSLIQIADALNAQLPALAEALAKANETGDLYAQAVAQDLLPLVEQAQVLGRTFDAVVANPPYMGGKYLTPVLKSYLKAHYAGYEKDLFSAFMIRDLLLAKRSGQLGFMSPFVWMFISSYEELRTHFIDHATLTSLVQLEYSGFDGATVPICTFTLFKHHVVRFLGSYVRLSDFKGADQQGPKTLEAIQNRDCSWFYTAKPDDFKKIPGSPVAYWASEAVHQCFAKYRKLEEIIQTREGLTTGSNDIFLRLWWEVSLSKVASTVWRGLANHPRDSRWYPLTKGGEFRRWAGNVIHVVDWEDDGARARAFVDQDTGRVRSHNYNGEFAFRPGFTWSAISSALFAVRNVSGGHMFDTKGPMGFAKVGEETYLAQSLLNSKVVMHFIRMMAPTLDFKLGHILNIPCANVIEARGLVEKCIALSEFDWNSYEQSCDFRSSPLLIRPSDSARSLESKYTSWVTHNRSTIAEMKRLEEENNLLFIDAYGLADELVPDVPIEQITLTVNPAYRYGGNLTEEEQQTRFRQDSMAELVSYAIGCMMGRYSLDEPGLIYAHAGNVGFDATRYKTFPADADGIVPITDEFWFEDDAANRVREFLRAVWGDGAVVSDQQSVDSKKLTTDHSPLSTNMQWLADSLNPKPNETPDETIRRYLADRFFKDHLQTYRKRPIYWLFSSGKQGAFQALVYLHRYHEGTLARLRAEYVVPLTGKMQARIEMLEKDATAAPSTAARNKLNKQIEKLRKKHVELLAYDEKLRHYADMRISLDLDDGVKVNYSKFGDLLAEVKAVTGGVED